MVKKARLRHALDMGLVILPVIVGTANLSAWSMRAGGFSLLLPTLVALLALQILPRLQGRQDLRLFARRATSPTILIACLYGAISMTSGLAGTRSPGSVGVAYSLASGLVVFIVYYVFVLHSPQARHWTLWGLAIGGFVLSVEGLVEYAHVLIARDTFFGVRAAGFWGDPNTFAYVLVLSSAAAWTLLSAHVTDVRHRSYWMRSAVMWTLLLMMSALALGVVASVSRSGLLALVLVTAWNLPLIRRLGTPVIVPLLLAVLAVGFALWNPLDWRALRVMDPRRLLELSGASTDRLNALWNGLYAFADSPITGGGYDASFRWSQRLYGTGVFSHNQLIDILASGGLVTVVPWLALVLLQFREGLRRSRDRFPVLFIIWFVCVAISAHFLMYHVYTWIGLALCAKQVPSPTAVARRSQP